MYRLNASKPLVAGIEYTTTDTNKILKLAHGVAENPSSIDSSETNRIATIAQSRSLAAKVMMYRLMVDRSLGFLYTTKQTTTFPRTLGMFTARKILD